MRPKRSWQSKLKPKVFPSARVSSATLLCAISKEFGVMGAKYLMEVVIMKIMKGLYIIL